MSVFADDVVNFSSFLKMAYDFLAGREYLKKLKFKQGKKLISVVLGFSDIVFASEAIPVFPIRMESFNLNPYLVALNSVSSVLGWDLTSKVLGVLKQVDSRKIIDKIVDDIINAINEKYNEMNDLAVENGISSDFCYGIKGLYGMHLSKGKNVDASLYYTIRCSAFNKYHESIKPLVARQIWVDIPPRNIGNALEFVSNNITSAITQLEDITGSTITDNQLNKQFNLSNKIKKKYKTILYEISNSDFYPCNPATFAEILALLSITFQDYNSNNQRYLDNITNLENEMRERIRKGIGVDVSKMPRILLTPMFGGWEPKTQELLYEMGARTLYADWEILGLLEEINVSRNSNPIEEYGKFLINATNNGIGCDNDQLTSSYLNIAEKLGVDGIIFNQLFGCHSISNCYNMLREKVRQRLEIPITSINFNRIGENIEQIKTRLGAFTEILQ